MYKQHLLNSIEREIILLKRLSAIIEEKDLAFRPAEKVRSTHELMQYLSSLGSNMLRWFNDPAFTAEERTKIREHNKTVTVSDFAARLDAQWKLVQEQMQQVSEEDLLNKEVELPWKEKAPLGLAIISAPVKWLATYRMQLFMNLKLNGRPDLGTKEAWIPDGI